MLSPQTIGVIVGRDLIGDALIKLPFLRALRNAFPAAEIHWITSHGPTAYAGALREATRALIDVVEECPDWLPAARGKAAAVQSIALPARYPPPAMPSFDLLIDTRNRWREALRARRIPCRLFLALAVRFLLSGKRPSLWQPRPRHIVDRLLQMVELAAGYMPVSTGALPVPRELMQAAERILPKDAVYVGLAPGAGNPVKIWPRDRFEKVALEQAAQGRVPVFILGPRERDWREEILAHVPMAIFPLQEPVLWPGEADTIFHTMAVAKRLSVAVANDSGTSHMLASVDCSLISLFGPTASAKLAPRVSHGAVIRAQDFGGTQMQAIPWEAVTSAVDTLLACIRD